MDDLLNAYFGPLGREYCLYFYFMSMFFFLLVVLGMIGIVVAAVKQPKKVDILFVANGVMLIFNALLAYYVNRLLNTMCMNSVR